MLCLASKKPSEREFFVPAGTDLAVKLLIEPGLVDILVVNTLSMTMEVSSNSTLGPYVIHMALSISQPVSKTLKQMQYWSECIKS